jgi:type IV secretory pathway component VirB8
MKLVLGILALCVFGQVYADTSDRYLCKPDGVICKTNSVEWFKSFQNDPVVISSIAKQMASQAVEKTEKEPVVSVEITAPGLAIVKYGSKQFKKVAVAFVLDHSAEKTPKEILDNPIGFRVVSYSLISK